MKRVSLKNEKKKGFTLVELIIVIAIIAILAAIAIPKFGTMRQTANVKADIATAKNIATVVAEQIAENKIKLDQNHAPITALETPASTTTTKDVVNITENLDGTPTAKIAEGTGSDFTVDIDTVGNIKVNVGLTEIYPGIPTGNHK